MNRTVIVIVVALLLRLGARAQEGQPESTPGMPVPSQSTPAMPVHAQNMRRMEMHDPQHISSDVAGVQEPENPNQRTGSNPSTPDLLEGAKAAPARTLEEFEDLALKNNPTLKQAQAMSRISSGLAHQAGLWPNPSIGYQGEQIRGGSFGGGEQGGFVQQTIVLGGKLGLRRKVFEEERKGDEIGIQEQQLSIRGAVRVQFYATLAQLRVIEIQSKLLDIAMDAAATSHQLANVGQADAPDVLQAEVEAEQAKLEFMKAQRAYMQSYEELAAVAGQSDVPLALLKGDLDHPPAIDTERYLNDLLENSPTLKRAQQDAVRAHAELARDQREAIPDLNVRAGVEQNQETLETFTKPVGVQSFASIGIQIPVFNRNQGNIQAAKAQVDRGQAEVERIRMELLEAAHPLIQQYLLSRMEEERYRTELIPRAQRAYELYLEKYRNMAAAYPSVIVSQRTLFQLEDNYARALGQLWTTAVQLQNYLLADGTSVPRSSRPASTQINLPMNGGGSE
jgi:outer membrane protein, heavy metal efflux system